LENIGLDRKIIIKPILERDGRAWSIFILLITGTGGGPCSYGNELSGSTQYGKFNMLIN